MKIHVKPETHESRAWIWDNMSKWDTEHEKYIKATNAFRNTGGNTLAMLYISVYTVVANFPKAMCNLQTRENEHKLKCRIVNALSLRVVLGNNLCQLVYLQNSQKAFSLITTQWIESCLYIQILYFLFLPQITKHNHLILISTYVLLLTSIKLLLKYFEFLSS